MEVKTIELKDIQVEKVENKLEAYFCALEMSRENKIIFIDKQLVEEKSKLIKSTSKAFDMKANKNEVVLLPSTLRHRDHSAIKLSKHSKSYYIVEEVKTKNSVDINYNVPEHLNIIDIVIIDLRKEN